MLTDLNGRCQEIPLLLLPELWGTYLQRRVIVSFVNGNDVFAILPTGYGKSLCLACLPLVFDILFNPQDASKYDSWAKEWLGYSHQCPFSLCELC